MRYWHLSQRGLANKPTKTASRTSDCAEPEAALDCRGEGAGTLVTLCPFDVEADGAAAGADPANTKINVFLTSKNQITPCSHVPVDTGLFLV